MLGGVVPDTWLMSEKSIPEINLLIYLLIMWYCLSGLIYHMMFGAWDVHLLRLDLMQGQKEANDL